MQRKRVSYKEGDWVGVPLPRGGYGLGIVARKSRGGVLLGYFFGPRLKRIPAEIDTCDLNSANAILIAKFGDFGILYGDWPVIHRPSAWRRKDWPLPDLGRLDIMNPQIGYRTTYNEDNLTECIREVKVSAEEAKSLPKDCLSGFLALATHLDRTVDE